MANKNEQQNGFSSDNDDLDAMMGESSSSNDNDDLLTNKRKKKNRRNIVIGVASAAVIAAAFSGVVVLNPFGGNQEQGNKTKTDTTSKSSDNGGDNQTPQQTDANSQEAFYQEKGKYYPVSYQDWQIVPFENQSGVNYADTKNSDANTQATSAMSDEVKKNVLNYYSSSEITTASNVLPSEGGGYTADNSKEFDESGGMNPYYSFWTAEVFQSETGTDIQRLINPTFGGWDLYQYSAYPANKYFNIDLVSDMFSNRWVNDNANKPMSEYVPVYADWNGNDYGMGDKLLDSGPRWYGEVTSSETTFAYDDATQQYTANMTLNIKYTAWAKDQSKLEKNGVMTLKLIPNVNGAGNSSHKVLIDEASLKVE